MNLGVEALLQCRDNARLAEAGFARDQDDLSFALTMVKGDIPSNLDAMRAKPIGRTDQGEPGYRKGMPVLVVSHFEMEKVRHYPGPRV
jgi:hypothetical protein